MPLVAPEAVPLTLAMLTVPEEAAGAGGAPLGLIGGAGTSSVPQLAAVFPVCVPPYAAADPVP